MSYRSIKQYDESVPLDKDKEPPKQETKEPTPLPLAPLFVLCCIILSESFSITMIFPFLADMVKDFGITTNDEEIGFYAGWIASSFNIAQFTSSFGWGKPTVAESIFTRQGRVSDKLGRRPVLLVGLAGNMCMVIFFGCATSLWYAILARSLNGFLNGNVGVAKTYLAEITDDTNASKGFSVFGFVWGLGLIIGPSIGGYLSNPHQLAPDIFPEGSLFFQFPYLLPCLVSAVITFFGFIVGAFYLPETLKDSPCQCNFTAKYCGTSGESTPLLEKEAPAKPPPTPRSTKKQEWVILEFFKNREVLVTTALYSILACYTMIFDEVFAIWATYGGDQGGIAFDSTDIGTCYMISGVTLLLSQFLVFPYAIQYFGPLRLYQISSFVAMVIHPLIPVCSELVGTDRWRMWMAVGTIFIFRSVFGNFGFTSVMLLVNNSAVPSKLGATNGFAQTICSGLRAVAPTIGGSMLAWSLTNQLPFPMNRYLSFLFISLCACINMLLCFLLDRNSIEHRKVEPEEDDIALDEIKKPYAQHFE